MHKNSYKRLKTADFIEFYEADRFPEVYDMCKKYKLKIMKMQFIHDIHSSQALRIMLKLKIGPMTKIKIYEPIMIDRGQKVKASYTIDKKAN